MGVPDNQILLHFGVPDNQILLHLDVPNICSGLLLRGRQSRSLEKGFTPQTEEHWGSLQKMRSTALLYIVHCIVYSVQCTLYTVHCTLYTVHVHPHLSVTVARQSPVLLISTSAEHGSRITYPPSQVWPSRAVVGDGKVPELSFSS